MRPKTFLLFCTLVSAACADDALDPVIPCTGDCTGLAMEIDSVRVMIPGQRTTAYSGDTLRVRVFVRNIGSVYPDELTRIRVSADLADTDIPMGAVRPGSRAAFDIPLKLPAVSRKGGTRDSVYVTLYRLREEPHLFQPLDDTIAKSFALQPTKIELRAVPTVLRYPSSPTAELVVTNPAPRAVPADSLSVCVFDVDYCLISAARTFMPAVGPGQTTIVPVTISMQRSASNSSIWDEWPDVDLRVCYGRDIFDGACDDVRIDLRPDYEAFCTVKRLTPGVTLQSTSVGAGCGAGNEADRLVITSFEAVGGRSYTVTAVGIVPELYTPDGVQIGGGPTVRPLVSGRHYLIGRASGNYSLRID